MRIYNPTTSSGGGSGETGPTGASGLDAALTFAYRLDLSGPQNLETLPSQGEIRFVGGSDPFSATRLLVHKDSIDLDNVGSIFLSLERGHLTLTSQTQPNNFATYSFSQVEDGSGFPDDYVIFHVSLVGQFNTPSDDDVISFGIAVTGETGATGPTGPAGQSSSFFNYQAKSNINFPPGTTINNGHVKWNSSTQTSATQIAFSHIDQNGNDVDVFFALYKQGDIFIIQDKDDSNNYQKWQISGTPTIGSGYIILPVTFILGDGANNFTDNHQVIFVVTSLGLQGATGATGAQGIQGATGVCTSTNVQVFTSDNTWTKPAGAKQVVIECVSGGGGGGYGGKGAAGTALYGGAGGGAGGYSRVLIDAAQLTEASYTVTVGIGGNGGNGVTLTNAQLGTYTRFIGAVQGQLAGTNAGGTVAGNGGPAQPSTGSAGAPAGNNGGIANITGTGGAGAGSNFAPTSGGAGGGLTAAAVVGATGGVFSGGSGGNNALVQLSSNGGAASATANGTSATSTAARTLSSLVINGCGGGGGGACSFATGSGGNGANGTGYGSGGGGGGSTIGSGDRGNGGNGAPGVAVVTTYF